MKVRGSVSYIVLALVSLISVWAYFNQLAIRDWWILRTYLPPEAITRLAHDAQFSDQGRRLFYVTKPELNERDEFNQNCNFTEKSLVLGCYSHSRIYIYNVDSQKLGGIEEVTAAHELLHAVYERMDDDERERIDKLTAQALDELKDKRIKEVIEGYRQDDPSTVPNELHSILGSEVSKLPAELEEHYSLYFDDRQALVKLAESYEAVFTKLRNQLTELETQIAKLKAKITDYEQQLASDQQSLDAENERLTQLRQSGQIAAYNAAVPGYNAQVNAYNALIATYKSTVSKHNQLVAEFNAIALEQNELVQSIDSKYQPID